MRLLKAVSEFDSFVSSKDWKVLISDSIVKQLKLKVVGDGPEHLFRLYLFELCFYLCGSQLNFLKCRDLRELQVLLPLLV